MPETFACSPCECGGQCDECNVAPFPHPVTGVVLETKDQFLEALNEIELRMSPWWIARRKIREAFAERFEPTLPSPVYRTVTQEKVARCPRCGSGLTTGGRRSEAD